MCLQFSKLNRSRVHPCRPPGTDASFLFIYIEICKIWYFRGRAAFTFPRPVLLSVLSCGCPVGPMGPPHVANPEKCKLLSPTGNYAPPLAVPVRFQAPRSHMHIGGILNGVYLAHFSGLAVILVPKRTTGTRAVVKKRKTGLGNLFLGGLGAMRVAVRT